MFARKIVIVILLTGIIFGPIAPAVFASTSTQVQSKAQLLQQIQILLAEVLRLQNILQERSVSDSKISAGYTPYESVYFPLSFEAIYLVKNGELINTKKSNPVRLIDKQLFDLFTSIIGKEAVTKYLKEWRVFQNDSSDLGAFVELIAGTEDWIVGVNRDGYEENDKQVTESFINLYIHEYAHILLFSKPDFEKDFKDTFWTAADIQHESKVKRAAASSKFNIMSHYFDDNYNRFVSDYATMNWEEDMAETFLSFVLEDKPTGTTVKEKKILAFYQEVDFVKLRTQLRLNLIKLDAL